MLRLFDYGPKESYLDFDYKQKNYIYVSRFPRQPGIENGYDEFSGGVLKEIRKFWSQILCTGPRIGYRCNIGKMWLVEAEHYDKVVEIFADTDLKIFVSGAKHLGAAIGNRSFVETYVSGKFRVAICKF